MVSFEEILDSIEDEIVLSKEEVFEVFTETDLGRDGGLDASECVNFMDMSQKFFESTGDCDAHVSLASGPVLPARW